MKGKKYTQVQQVIDQSEGGLIDLALLLIVRNLIFQSKTEVNL